MPQWMQDLTTGWPMIRANIPTFIVLTVLIFGVVWWLMDWRYGGIIANRDSEISSLKTQKDEYKDKLNGATPDQAKARIDALEARLARVEPRHLTEAQQTDLVNRLRNGTSSIRIDGDLTCADCGQYKGDLARTFRDAAGWQVLEGSVMGPNNRPATGLGFRIQNPKKPTADQQRIIDAFRANNIRFDLQQLVVPAQVAPNDIWGLMELLIVAP